MDNCRLVFPMNFAYYPTCSVYFASPCTFSKRSDACWCSAFSNRRLPCNPVEDFLPLELCSRDRLCDCSFYLLSILTVADPSVLSDTTTAIDLRSLRKSVWSLRQSEGKGFTNGNVMQKWADGAPDFQIWWNSSFRLYLWPHSLLIKVPHVIRLVKESRIHGYSGFWVYSFKKTYVLYKWWITEFYFRNQYCIIC